MHETDFDDLTCPIPHSNLERVLLGHGSGGKLTADLIQRVFLSELSPAGHCPSRDGPLEDSAILNLQLPSAASPQSGEGHSPRIAFTTDCFVVKPLFFPGGDIGKLAVHGTVNDLAVAGATPLYMSAAFILEEGFELQQLRLILASMRTACLAAGIALVTGDTKVVDRGHGDDVFIITSGIGQLPPDRRLSISHARPGDRVIVSGTIGDHGITIMSTRAGIEFETTLISDTAPLNSLTEKMLAACRSLRLMRDPTRGGISSTLNELAAASGVGVVVEEAAIPIRPEVQAACEMLGLDPLYVANEGKLIAVVPAADADELLAVMRQHPLGREAAIIGTVVADHPGMVVMRSLIGGQRVVTMLSGEQLPRIC